MAPDRPAGAAFERGHPDPHASSSRPARQAESLSAPTSQVALPAHLESPARAGGGAGAHNGRSGAFSEGDEMLFDRAESKRHRPRDFARRMVATGIGLGLVAFLGARAAAAAESADYPARPIRVIVGFAPGGSADLTARALGQKMAELLGQPVVVDNRAGASGIIGTDLAARATPDGYTLLEATMTTHGIGPNLYKKLPYDPIGSFAPIALMVRIPLVLFAHASVPASSLKQLIAHLKANPAKYRYASAGNGSPPHLAAELFKLKAGVELLHVPYKGTGAAVPDVVAGQIHFMIDGPPPFLGHVKAGRLRALATANAKRLAQLPDVPTFGEQGLDGMEAGLWYGMLAPKGTPRAIVDRLNAAINQALRDPDVIARFTAASIEVVGGTPEELGRYVAAEIKRWGEVARAAKIQIE
ncbi:MAG: tripartite tricarboxylate transporter substrate binding protein [Betaproteobacteria bacterium]|nr:MAG: tripartite tricarboxylate transporter substrate binding protein [Betaproteobacteria bacterium]